jgi:two-component system, OmpR family, sensor histidine kinase TctE
MWRRLMSAGRESLTIRLLSVIVLPLCGLAVLLGIGGALVITKAVQTVNDRILAATSRAIADSLTIEDGQISLDLPPGTFGMLEDIERDNVYYNVRYGDHVLTGYSDLPEIAPTGMADLQVKFGDSIYHRKDIRVIAEGRRLPGLSQPVVVEVAETMDARRISERQLLQYLAILELTLIALTVLILPVAVRWGMRPLDRVRADMDLRAASDLHPIGEKQVPSEIRTLVRGFNDLLGRFAGVLEDTRRFTADASHQMRTPLSILRAHIALIRNAPPGSKEASESLNDLDEASERLQHLVVQLLALARADNAARAELPLKDVNLNLLVEEVCADHAPAAVAANIELEFDPAVGDSTAMSDPVLAREMIANLIDNAIRYGGTGASIYVSVKRAEAELLVAVEDNGPGIAPELRQAVFSRFTRLNPDTNRSGSGLGLPIAQSLANAIRARMVLGTPASGNGLRVEIYFPRAPTES